MSSKIRNKLTIN